MNLIRFDKSPRDMTECELLTQWVNDNPEMNTKFMVYCALLEQLYDGGK